MTEERIHRLSRWSGDSSRRKAQFMAEVDRFGVPAIVQGGRNAGRHAANHQADNSCDTDVKDGLA